jgi:hypothetical protein
MTLRHSVFGCFVFAILAAPGCTTSAKKAEPPAATNSETSPSKATTPETSPLKATAPEAPPSTASAAQATSAPSSPAEGGAPQVGATAVNPIATAEIATAALAGSTSAGTHASVAEAAVSPASSAPHAVVAPAVDAPTPEMVRKRAQIDWALKQDEIKNDPHGQWAVQAKASSSYNDGQGMAAYSASQATGIPNVEVYGDSKAAWTPKTPNGGIEWLELQFAKPVHATSIRVRESYSSGTVFKVDIFDEQGAAHTVWSGIDPTKNLDYLTVEFPRTAFKTSRVKVTLATNTISGFKQIDAVQLIGTEQ